ncbi:LacI family DNA-binding transcriptional regulator [Sphingomonas endolithica]|uniref:LacI family DNA-binding transcriptional regulator n=1 Tax=Sphingomonas endolithica TaxID=2972485 RepID=UPI0021AEA07C|nr:LacI family DNA-binding transcriptional regulator [Sphingomonas sp. ZFBP2030]
MPHATIRDVAREAAVSVATVSRVLNGHENVRPALKLRVQGVAARLGYVPHAGARHLSLARSGAIGVVLPDLHGEFFSELLRGIDWEASSRGLQLLLTVMHDRPGRGIDVLATMRGRVDGIVLMAPHIPQDVLVAHLPAGLPTMLLNCGPDDGDHAALRLDNQAGAIAMIDHLVSIGRGRIVHIAGPDSNLDARERRRGVEMAATRAGIEVRIMPGDFRQETGVAAATELLRDLQQVDAIFAANDMMAMGALMTLKRAGVAVPDQVAVAGFDDIPLAGLISPSLTTMRIDTAAFGARAVARLAHLVDGITDRTIEPITPTLVIRETTESLNKGRNAGELSS